MSIVEKTKIKKKEGGTGHQKKNNIAFGLKKTFRRDRMTICSLGEAEKLSFGDDNYFEPFNREK